MIRLLLSIALLILPSLSAADGPSREVLDSVMVMYTQSMDGGMRAACTATIYEKYEDPDEGPGYYLASSAHCVANVDDEGHTKSRGDNIYLSFDKIGPKTYYPAHIEGYGDLSRGDDFVVLHAYTREDWTVMPLGHMKDVAVGESVFNVAGPLGLGLQVFQGTVSLMSLDRPVRARGINWQYAMLVQLPAAGGSSGSAVVSAKQNAIIGFVVGTIGSNPSTVVIPVSRFKAFVRRVSGREPGVTQ